MGFELFAVDAVAGGLRVREILRERGEILLRLGQVTALQVLPELLKLTLNLLEASLAVLRDRRGAQ